MVRIAGEELAGTAARAAPWSILRRSYHESVVDHCDGPRDVGSFEKDDPGSRHGPGRSAGVRRRHEALDQRRSTSTVRPGRWSMLVSRLSDVVRPSAIASSFVGEPPFAYQHYLFSLPRLRSQLVID